MSSCQSISLDIFIPGLLKIAHILNQNVIHYIIVIIFNVSGYL